MKLLSRLLTLLAVPAVMMLGGCDKEEETPANLYQEYEVLVENGNASAFANLRLGGPSGERVKIKEGKLTVNMLPMYYQSPTSPTEPEYTYFATLATNHEKAIFRLKNSAGKTLTNTSEYGAIEAVVTENTSLYDVHGGERVKILLNGAFVADIKVWLVGNTATSTPTQLNVIESLNFASPTAEVVIPAVTGVYDLVIDRIEETPVREGDGAASGQIRTIIRSRRPLKVS